MKPSICPWIFLFCFSVSTSVQAQIPDTGRIGQDVRFQSPKYRLLVPGQTVRLTINVPNQRKPARQKGTIRGVGREGLLLKSIRRGNALEQRSRSAELVEVRFASLERLEILEDRTSLLFPGILVGGIVGGYLGGRHSGSSDPPHPFAAGIEASVKIGEFVLGIVFGTLAGGLIGSNIHIDSWTTIPPETYRPTVESPVGQGGSIPSGEWSLASGNSVCIVSLAF